MTSLDSVFRAELKHHSAPGAQVKEILSIQFQKDGRGLEVLVVLHSWTQKTMNQKKTVRVDTCPQLLDISIAENMIKMPNKQTSKKW